MTEDPKDPGLLVRLDAAAEALLNTAFPATIHAGSSEEKPPAVDIRDQIAAFTAVSNYGQARFKIALDKPKRSGIAGYRDTINNSKGGGRGSRPASPSGANGSASDGAAAGD